MKKLGLLTTLLVAGLLLSGCSFNVNVNDTSSVVDEDKPSIKTESGRLFACNEEVGKHYNITTFGGGWDIEHEDGTSFVLNGEITYEKNRETIVKNVQCVVDMVDNSVTILEIEEPVVEEPEVSDEEDGTILIPADGITYRNDEYGFQIKFGKERSGGKIYDSFRKYNIYNYNTDYDGGIKNPFIVFTVPSPRRTGKFEDIADIIVYTYEEYEQARQNQMNPECMMCSLEEFDKAIIGKNNKYYFLLGRSNRSDDELKTMFPSLECREETDSSVYGTYTYIYCDGIEYINGEPKKTGKNWIEQIMPAESFEFFDVKENAENNEFLEDIKSNGAQPQRKNNYPETPTLQTNVKYPKARNYCLENNGTIIKNDYGDEFCSRQDGSYYELRAYEQNGQAGRRGTDEPYCSIYEDIVCGIDGISYVNECRLKDAGVEKDKNAKFVDGKCVKK